MSNRYILVHDLGTTGNKASLFDAVGLPVGSAFGGYDTSYPHPNWAEQSAHDWWRAVCHTTHDLLAQTCIAAADIAAIGFSGQMMGCLPVDRTGTPLRSCIIWADQRSQEQAAHIAERCGADAVYTRSGHRPSAAYTAAKILWLRDHQPDLYAQSACFLQPKDWVIHQLTGHFVTDYSDASGTLLFDLGHRCWNDDFLCALDLSHNHLPSLHPSTTVVGEVTPAAAAATGLCAGTPVVVGGGDGACAGVGAGAVFPGDTYCYIGSSAWISMSTAQPVLDPERRTFTFHGLHPDYYCPMGTMQAAGGARDWAWKLLAGDNGELDTIAAQVDPTASKLLFLPYLLGERSPHWNPLARGAFVGLAMPHGQAEMARAVLDGVALNLGLILDTLRKQVPNIKVVRVIGGGSRSALWPQILADCFGLPTELLSLTAEATAWGAAMAGGVGIGLYDWSLAAERVQIVSRFEPTELGMEKYGELASIFRDAYLALEPIYARLAALS